jgi:hypothetical protein
MVTFPGPFTGSFSVCFPIVPQRPLSRRLDLCNVGHPRTNNHATLSYMTIPDPEFQRLILQIERDLLAQANLRVLLTAANTTLAGHRQELQSVTARMKRVHRSSWKRPPR